MAASKKNFFQVSDQYGEGKSYGMKAQEIHSIQFSKDALVLMKEGFPCTEVSSYLLPVVDEVVLPTFKTEDWMFK